MDASYAQNNPNNTIRIEPFFIVDEESGEINFESEKDTELLKLITELEFFNEHYQSQINKWVDRSILDFKESDKNKKTLTSDVEVAKSKSYSPSQKD